MFRFASFLAILSLFFVSCRDENPQTPYTTGVIRPQNDLGTEDRISESGEAQEEEILPLVDLGENQRVLDMLDINLDEEQSDEQILLSMPINAPDEALGIYIASTNLGQSEYSIVWSRSLTTRSLQGVSLRAEDITGNGREEILVAGFDERGMHVTEIFHIGKQGNLQDYRPVFQATIDGNIDIVSIERPPAYWMGQSDGEPFAIVVQEKSSPDPESLDLSESTYSWNGSSSRYEVTNTQDIRGTSLLEERLRQVYSGGVLPYEDYLSGSWYRENSDGDYAEMLLFDPDRREIMFFDGSIIEVYSWGTSHRTTPKRIYSRITNELIPSQLDTIWVSAESWETLQFTRAIGKSWNDSYRRFGQSIQTILTDTTVTDSLIQSLPLSGLWRSPGGMELLFDLPSVTLRDGGDERQGSASLFSFHGNTVLQIRYRDRNGTPLETANWLIDYGEDADETRIIRSLTLTPAHLTVNEVRSNGTPWRRFEQIEVVTTASDE